MRELKQRIILLVEDEAVIALSEIITLEGNGYKVLFVNSGEKAIETVNTNSNIDLILMDINLGKGINGIETAKQILSKQEIPLIFLTSLTEYEVADKTNDIGYYDYVFKSIDETKLIASIRRAIEGFDER